MTEVGCSNTGPLIHLYEIGRLETLRALEKIYVPDIVLEQATLPGRAERKELEALGILDVRHTSKEAISKIREKLMGFDLHEGELEALALCKETGTITFLTDDLDARDAAITLGLKPRGSVGVLVRAFQSKLLNLQEAKQSIFDLFDKSSLFITKAIVDQAIEELEKLI